jgi:hypothetical protein
MNSMRNGNIMMMTGMKPGMKMTGMGITGRALFTRMRHAAALAVLAGCSGLSDLPAAVDRVPTDAMVVITVDNLEQFEQRSRAMMESLGVAKDDESNPFEMFDKLATIKGLNRGGSVAAFMMKPEKKDAPAEEDSKSADKASHGNGDGDEADAMGHDADDAEDRRGSRRGQDPEMLTLVPVSDYAALVTSLGGTAGPGVSEVQIDQKTEYLRDLGGGYALLGGKKKAVEGFKPVEGVKKQHAAALGKVGLRIADQNQVLVIANISQMQEMIRDGAKKLSKQAEAMAGMAGPMAGNPDQMKQQMEMAQSLAENFARDAQVGILGIHLAEKGFWIDLGVQFKEGSEVGKLFTNKGSAGKLLAKLPDQPFVMAVAIDSMGNGIKHMLREASKQQTIAKVDGKDGATAEITGSFDFMGITKLIDKVDGAAMLMGASPGGMMGGLFANTMSVVQTKDGPGYIASMKETVLKTNNATEGGMTYKTEYKDGIETIGSTKVDSWKMVMQPDANNPNAQQIMMVQGMLFGPSIGGYLGQTDNIVVGTMSPNRLLMKEALDVASGAAGSKSLGSNADIAAMQKILPENRTFEGYVGVKPIMEMAQNAMAMFMGPIEWQAPEKLSPIALGGTTDESGMHTRIYIPSDVVRAATEFGKAMQKLRGPGGEEPGDMEGGDEEEAPKF